MAFLACQFVFVVHFVAKRYILQQKCLKGQIGTCARNTLVQLLAAYTNPESQTQNAQHYRQTDGQQAAANSRSYCVAVRLAKNEKKHSKVGQ